MCVDACVNVHRLYAWMHICERMHKHVKVCACAYDEGVYGHPCKLAPPTIHVLALVSMYDIDARVHPYLQESEHLLSVMCLYDVYVCMYV